MCRLTETARTQASKGHSGDRPGSPPARLTTLLTWKGANAMRKLLLIIAVLFPAISFAQMSPQSLGLDLGQSMRQGQEIENSYERARRGDHSYAPPSTNVAPIYPVQPQQPRNSFQDLMLQQYLNQQRTQWIERCSQHPLTPGC